MSKSPPGFIQQAPNLAHHVPLEPGVSQSANPNAPLSPKQLRELEKSRRYVGKNRELNGEKYAIIHRIWDIIDFEAYTDDLIEMNPIGFIAIDGSEMDIAVLYGIVIGNLKNFCEKYNKRITVFGSAWPADYVKPHYVDFVKYYGYDMNNYIQNMIHYSDSLDPNLDLYGDNFSPDLLFTCYNNSPRDYRSYTINTLAKNNLLDSGMVTYRWFTVELPKEPDWRSEYWNMELEHVPYGTVLEDPLENVFVLNSTRKYECGMIPASYHRGLIDIVTESRIDKDEFYLSEKTNKPLMTHKPFLVVSSQGYHQWLKSRGIELYDEIFDYSFDNLPDYEDRVDGIIENLKRLSEVYKTPEDYKRLWNSVKEKTQRNFFHYMAYMRHNSTYDSIHELIGLDMYNPEISGLYNPEAVDEASYPWGPSTNIHKIVDHYFHRNNVHNMQNISPEMNQEENERLTAAEIPHHSHYPFTGHWEWCIMVPIMYKLYGNAMDPDGRHYYGLNLWEQYKKRFTNPSEELKDIWLNPPPGDV